MPPRFPAHERARLLAMPRIGPTVIQRLEQAGIASLARLQQIGVEAAVHAVCAQLGSVAWANRERALRSALDRLKQA
ncbi:MAG: helix-hairpin-helix domain-containing protein [Burkholderiaceae bacterium]|nr:helix-hairpin-helix domain-containing protein [Burkholderiaceae bacterium]